MPCVAKEITRTAARVALSPHEILLHCRAAAMTFSSVHLRDSMSTSRPVVSGTACSMPLVHWAAAMHHLQRRKHLPGCHPTKTSRYYNAAATCNSECHPAAWKEATLGQCASAGGSLIFLHWEEDREAHESHSALGKYCIHPINSACLIVTSDKK